MTKTLFFVIIFYLHVNAQKTQENVEIIYIVIGVVISIICLIFIIILLYRCLINNSSGIDRHMSEINDINSNNNHNNNNNTNGSNHKNNNNNNNKTNKSKNNNDDTNKSKADEIRFRSESTMKEAMDKHEREPSKPMIIQLTTPQGQHTKKMVFTDDEENDNDNNKSLNSIPEN